MEWGIEYSSSALAELAKFDRSVRRHVLDRVEWFARNFDGIKPEPLHGDWKGFFKFRAGDWRVVYVYAPADGVIRVHQIDRRDKVYKKRR